MGTSWQTTLVDDLQKLSETVSSRVRSETKLRKGERRSIAVLFLDLKGFTELSESLDHEIVYDLVGGVMKALAGVVEGYGGYVDKIEGDRIMALFGATRAAENDSVRAVSCGLKMSETIDGVNRMLEGKDIVLGFRGGISRGPVTVAPDAVGHLTATGDTVNLASRMEETAPGNTFQVEQVTRDDCGEAFSWDTLGEVAVRGRKETVSTFVPLGPGTDQKMRWERAALIAGSPLVGRTDELSWLEGCWNDLESGSLGNNLRGSPRHLVAGIRGEAGIGKSRLVHEFLRKRVESDGARVFRGNSVSFGQQGFQLWSSLVASALLDGDETGTTWKTPGELIDRLMDGIGDCNAVSQLRESGEYLAQLVSGQMDKGGTTDSGDRSRQMETMIAVRNLIRVLACPGRTVLVLEDLHWMDEASMKTLKFVLSNCNTDTPLLLVCLYRPGFDPDPSQILQDAEDYAEFREITLESVSPGVSMELVSHMLGAPCSSAIEEFVLDRSMGNPLFLEELVTDLIESGLIVETDGSWDFCTSPGNIYVPDSLAGLVHSRLDRMAPPVREDLQICSVLGLEFSGDLFLDVRHRLASAGKETDPLQTLLDMGFLVSKGMNGEATYLFRHVLIHDTVYETILHCNRRLIHRLAATVLEESTSREEDPLSPVISRHWELAGDREKAVKWGLAALGYYRTSYLTSEGLSLSCRMIEKLEQDSNDSAVSDQLIIALEKYYAFLGFSGRRDEQFEVVDRLLKISEEGGREDLRCRALRYKGIIYDQVSEFEKAREVFAEALDLSRKLKLRELEGSLTKDLAGPLIDQGRMEEADDLLRQAIRISIETDNRLSEGIALCTMGILKRRMGLEKEALEWYEQALDIQSELGDRWQIGIILGNMAIAQAELGNTEKAIEFASEARNLARETGNRMFEAMQTVNMAEFLMVKGRNEEAIDPLREAILLFREIGNRYAEGITLMNLGVAYSWLSDTSKTEECFRKAIDLFREIGDVKQEADTLEQLCGLLIKTDRLSEASDLLSLARDRTADTEDPALIARVTCCEGLLCIAGGNMEKAEILYSSLVDQVNGSGIGEEQVPDLRILRSSLAKDASDYGSLPLPDGWPESPEEKDGLPHMAFRIHV